ncbi:MAG: hypothetical protein ABGZ53_00795 [Fuerstiella sp.]|nr:hypothetical protein [Fuerstiella sp.]
MSVIALILVSVSSPQSKDLLLYGDHTFEINEIPMLGLWDYGDAEPAQGKKKPPTFDFAGFGNWAGYDATWLIRDSKLYLHKIRGERDGKRIRNEKILPDHDFPVVATWFSGRIHVAVGGFNHDTEKHESVIVFHVEKGIVQRTTFESSLEYTFEWNGMASGRSASKQ